MSIVLFKLGQELKILNPNKNRSILTFPLLLCSLTKNLVSFICDIITNFMIKFTRFNCDLNNNCDTITVYVILLNTSINCYLDNIKR